jgi:hypothetical protein
VQVGGTPDAQTIEPQAAGGAQAISAQQLAAEAAPTRTS